MRCRSWHDDLWLIDSTPVECRRSREAGKRSNLVGVAGHGYCASTSRHPRGLAIAYAPTNLKHHDRVVARDLLETTLAYSPTGRVRPSWPTTVTTTPRNSKRSSRTAVRPDQIRVVQDRTSPARAPLPPAIPPDHRIDQPHPQNNQPRTATDPRPLLSRGGSIASGHMELPARSALGAPWPAPSVPERGDISTWGIAPRCRCRMGPRHRDVAPSRVRSVTHGRQRHLMLATGGGQILPAARCVHSC
jgi:hypothetical protein